MPSRSLFWASIILLVTVAAGLGTTLILRNPPVLSEELLQQARLKLARGDHKAAENLACQAAASRNPSPWSLLVAAEAVLKSNRYSDALAYYQRVPREDAAVAESADFGEAEMLCHLGRLSESERQLRELLQRSPSHNLAHYRLAFLLNITGRRWEAQSHLLHLVRNQAANMEQLMLLGNSRRQIEDRALLDASAKLVPDDPLPKLGAANLALTLGRTSEAKPLLSAVLLQLPREPEASVRWGQLLLEEDNPNPFIDWSTSLPVEVERHPDVWMLRGQFAQQRHELRVALRCFAEALRREPEHQGACHQIGRMLAELGETDRAVPFLERAELLQRLTVILDDLFHHRDHMESIRRVTLLSVQLGRLWEAASWASIALTMDPNLQWAREVLQEVSPHLSHDLPQTRPANDPGRSLELVSFPLPNWTKRQDPALISESREQADIRFIDQAREVGIEFQFENAADDSTKGARLFETTGGGAGVLDYDLDGWPDMYLTQGIRDPSLRDKAWTDRLFRNRADRFEDVTVAAVLGDRDFSQGITVGDFDNDGFPDLYVANLGQNRLYHNQGDGTFEDITEKSGVVESHWTTSCLIADLNGDGHPDLYDVNYVGGESLMTRICEKEGVLRSCSPRAFDPAPDRVWLNLGDGTFQDVSVDCGIDVPNGNGLGIVAMDLDGTGRLSLFIANDEVPNFLFVNTSEPGASIQFEEQGLIAGVALDADGESQACMGVGAGDADGDGLLDLFVTNFYLESNTLYRQISPGQFADTTRAARLRDPSFTMLGFGTQFIDADLDGWEDLVITNGHIDDLTSIGQPYQMPTQFMRNIGRGKFSEISAQKLGPFFQQNHLGRGLAKLDWDRDGRDDFVVSHLREPVALLTNTTPGTGHSFAIQLCGTRGSRDAIGTSVEITAGNRRFVKQLTGGDGYHASNERLLRFGLGTATRVDKLTVRWPGGPVQTLSAIAADRTVLLRENSDQLLLLDADKK